MTSPLRITFDVACPPEHAFSMWTSRIGTWWPSDHTVAGDPDLEVILESGVGGRIYERTSEGVEHDWGEETKPERADENERLIRDVFADLAKHDPGGLHYAAFRLDDGVSFLHVALIDGDENPLLASTSFDAFQSGIADRCTEGPIAVDATVVGSYGLLPD